MQELFHNKYKDKIATLIEIFTDAEHQIKSVERETSELSIPSINQLRYVAYHLIEILKNSENIDEELDKAINHAKRAKYDVLEISCLYYLEEIKEFQDKYSQYTETIDILPEYIKLMTDTQKNADEINKIDEKDKIQYYEKISSFNEKLKSISRTLNNAIPLINKKIEENNTKAIKENRKFMITIGLTLIGIIISASIAVVKLDLIHISDNNKMERS